MIPIEQITEQELEKRFGVLPDKLKEALDSARNNKIIDGVCRNHHLVGGDKILSIRQIAGIVLFGYIHPYDVASELNEWLELNNPQLAASIAQELDVKIFSPLKSELEKNYHPLAEETPPSSATRPQQLPTIIQEINPSTSLRVDAVRRIEKPASVSPAAPPAPSMGIKIRDLSQIVAPPKPLGDLPAAPFDSTQGKPKPPEGMATLPATRIPSPPAPAPTPSKVEGPFMIRREPEFKPLQPKKDAPRFDASLRVWSETKPFVRQLADQGRPGAMPIPRPARVDLGGGTSMETKKPAIGRTETPEAKIIHYSQWTTPPEKTGLGASVGGGAPVPLSKISNLTSQISKPPEPPQAQISDFRNQRSDIPAVPKPLMPSSPAKISFPVPPSPPKSVFSAVPPKLPDARFTPIDLSKLKLESSTPRAASFQRFDRLIEPEPQSRRPELTVEGPPAPSSRIPEPPRPPAPSISPITQNKTPMPPRGNVIDLSKI